MAGKKPKKKAEKKEVNAWVELVRGGTQILLRLIDRGHVGFAFATSLVMLSALAIYRVPSENLGSVFDALAKLLEPGVLIGAIAGNIVSAMIISGQRKHYRAELTRVTKAKKLLEQTIDDKRPETGLGADGRERIDDNES